MNLSKSLNATRTLLLFATEGLALMCLGAFICLYFWFLGWNAAAFLRGKADLGNFVGSVFLGLLLTGIYIFMRRTKQIETVRA